jgi:hypothetical protein
MALEDAYLKAIWGNAPDPQWLSGISSRDFRLLVESLSFYSRAACQARRTSWRRSCSTTKSLSDITSAVTRRKPSSLTSHGTGVLPSFSVSQRSFLVNTLIRLVQDFAPTAPRYSLSCCNTFLGKIISIFLQRPELGPKGCRMTSGEP